MDVVDITAKVLCKDELTVVGGSRHRKSDCYITDGSCKAMKLVLWEKNIELISDGEVYTFKGVRARGVEVRFLNTTVETSIEKKGDSELKQLVEDDHVSQHSTGAN